MSTEDPYRAVDPEVADASDDSEPSPRSVDLARAAFAAAKKQAKDQPPPPRTGRRRRRHTDPTVSSARSDDRDPQLLGSAVDRLLTERGWETDVAVAGAIGRWDQIVGADIAAHVRPERYEDTVLHVLADSSAWATQTTYLAPTLVRRLNEELGDGTVSRLQVHRPNGPSWRKGAFRVPGRGPRDTYG